MSVARLIRVGLAIGWLAGWPALPVMAASETSDSSALPTWGQLHYEVYQVRPGDTIQNVATRFGVEAAQIANLNRISGEELIPGQSLAIPLPGAPKEPKEQSNLGVLHTVKRTFAPRFAIVSVRSQISSKHPPENGRVLYEVQAGTRLLVNAEEGDYWGVVMADGSTGWALKSGLQVTDRTISSDSLENMLRNGGRTDIIQEAYRYLGTSYRYGGQLPSCVDCSLLVQTVFAAHGVSLPRTAAAQFEVGFPVNYNELQPGDRIYFVSRSGYINHAGIYIGNGQFIHASSRRGCVAVDSLTEPLYWSRFAGGRR